MFVFREILNYNHTYVNEGIVFFFVFVRQVIFAKNSEKYLERIRELESENKDLKLKLEQANLLINSLRKIFTEGQIRKMMNSGKVLWKWEDISNAICLHAAGPRAYNHLYEKGFPLPHESTLQRWCRKINVDEGIITSALDFMREITNLSHDEKLCVLCFDEMKVMEVYEYEAGDDKVRMPAKYVQVMMVRGLKKSWKQPIFFAYDCKMTKDILFKVICSLYNAGFQVVATVCDMGSVNFSLLKELGITRGKYILLPTTYHTAQHALHSTNKHY